MAKFAIRNARYVSSRRMSPYEKQDGIDHRATVSYFGCS